MTKSLNGVNEATTSTNQMEDSVKEYFEEQNSWYFTTDQKNLNQSPVDGDFLSQLARFSTNDGVEKMQESLQQLATSLQSNQALQASALVGRKVLVNNAMTFANVDSVSIGQTGEGLKLNVAGVGTVSLDQVKKIIV